ncbi:hypothetical protein RSOLAG1IB_03031 [Rhizoctonia solani AG-1 IB]|uniref:Uncharacterized protein n=1 Tax=Thanatephorus cucumeris (strain AG1-IB / isolate 7/3/14) TaxID=1108050 RepID=A0A0B7FKS7_THACB|nr:hypothetical protein RSOLAG1IB_03031 [Rhizoctonia solani AG-1 IB]
MIAFPLYTSRKTRCRYEAGLSHVLFLFEGIFHNRIVQAIPKYLRRSQYHTVGDINFYTAPLDFSTRGTSSGLWPMSYGLGPPTAYKYYGISERN